MNNLVSTFWHRKKHIVEDVDKLSLNWSVISDFQPCISRYNGEEYWTSTRITLVDHAFTVKGLMFFELDSMDGDSRLWTCKFFFIPETAQRENYELHLPDLVETGYQAMTKGVHTDINRPTVARIDSLCMTSMIDGHKASAGAHDLGCECDMQRKKALDKIYLNGGISILSPFEGRGNGIRAHAGQIQTQNYAKRHDLEVLDTYEAVKLLGYPEDRRPNFYWLDALILKMTTCSKEVYLYSNNPEKIAVIEKFGIKVASRSLFDSGSLLYYQGVNFQAKIIHGRHKTYEES